MPFRQFRRLLKVLYNCMPYKERSQGRVLSRPYVCSPLACRNLKQLTKFRETSAGNHKICDSEFPTVINTNMAAVGVK